MPDQDHRRALRRSYANAAAIVRGVKDDRLADPTPCPAFDVATLVDHLVGAGWRAAALGRGETPTGEEFPHVALADASGQLEAAGGDAATAWSDGARLEATTQMPWGETYSGRVLVDMYLSELAAHAWDLAAATGQLGALDPGLAPSALEAARAMLKPEYRDVMGKGEPFGAEVEVGPGASDWERFAAFTGRTPGWRAPAGRAR
jgi:uncharacterized protein (TIGR03086 family)